MEDLAFQGGQSAFHDFAECDAMCEFACFVAATFAFDDRVKAMRFAFQNAGVDSATIGFKSTQEIDEAISNMNLALA